MAAVSAFLRLPGKRNELIAGDFLGTGRELPRPIRELFDVSTNPQAVSDTETIEWGAC